MATLDFMSAGILHYTRPAVAEKQARAFWTDYEPDYDSYISELESMQANMADVATYDDWFVEESA